MKRGERKRGKSRKKRRVGVGKNEGEVRWWRLIVDFGVPGYCKEDGWWLIVDFGIPGYCTSVVKVLQGGRCR